MNLVEAGEFAGMVELAELARAGDVVDVQIGVPPSASMACWRIVGFGGALLGIRNLCAILRRRASATIATNAAKSRARMTASQTARRLHPHSKEPPFTLITSPVMKVARSDTAKRIGPAISSAVPTRFRGMGASAPLQPGFGSQHRSGHIRIHPSRRHAIHQNIVRRQLERQALDEADDRAFRGGVVRVIRCAALAGDGAEGDDAAAFLRDHVRRGVVDHGVHALQIDANHFVPFALGQLLDGRVLLVPDSGVGHQDVDAAQAFAGEFDQLFGVGHFAEVGLE